MPSAKHLRIDVANYLRTSPASCTRVNQQPQSGEGYAPSHRSEEQSQRSVICPRSENMCIEPGGRIAAKAAKDAADHGVAAKQRGNHCVQAGRQLRQINEGRQKKDNTGDVWLANPGTFDARYLSEKEPLIIEYGDIGSQTPDRVSDHFQGKIENASGALADSFEVLTGEHHCKAKDLETQVRNGTSVPWVEVALVNKDRKFRSRRYPPRRYRAEGEYLIPTSQAVGVRPELREFPLGDQVPVTVAPGAPKEPTETLRNEVAANLASWEQCFSRKARERLLDAVGRGAKDEHAARCAATWACHRPRTSSNGSTSEVRIGWDEYHPTVRRVLQVGHTLKVSPLGCPSIREAGPLDQSAWGFNAAALRADGKKIDWPDKEVLFFLKWGFSDFSNKTPPVSSYSPHQKKALASSGEFHKVVRKEIDAGWLSEPQRCPTSVPFRINPGSVEDKKDGSKRLVWNASWPKPGTTNSHVRVNGGQWMPLSTNYNTKIPAQVLTEWVAIETNSEAIAIMASGARAAGMKLYARTYDLKKWFRQLAVSPQELWKCGVHALGGFREDHRMQMGRTSSAHSGQRVSTLIVDLIQRAALSERWGLGGDKGESQRKLEAWLNERNEQFPHDKLQARAVTLSVYQDDITAVAIGEKAATDAEEGIPRICTGRYGVELSKKEEANKPFGQTVSSIGATYDLSDLDNITCRPADKTMNKYREAAERLECHRGRLMPFAVLESFIGLHLFVTRFLGNGPLLCNSAYVCLRAAESVQTSKKMAPYSKEFADDVQKVLNRLTAGRLPALTNDPRFMHPGLAGATSDASGGCQGDARGWGVCIMGALAANAWSPEVQKALKDEIISIGPLELLGSAIALHVAGVSGKLPKGCRSIVLRNDNDSACAVANSGRATSGPMLEALKIFTKVRETWGLRVRLQHVEGKKNIIADHLSRGRYEVAEAEASKTWKVTWVQQPKELNQWTHHITRAGRRAKRSSALRVGGKSAEHS